jgi:hypothetical protein
MGQTVPQVNGLFVGVQQFPQLGAVTRDKFRAVEQFTNQHNSVG